MANYKGDTLTKLTGEERLGMHRESEYLGAEDIDPGKEPILTIEGIYYGKVTLQKGKENKDVLKFVENSVDGICEVRPLIVNATNRKTLRSLFKKVDAVTLEGKKIQIYVDTNVRDPQTGGITDGIRIRPYMPREQKYYCSECKKEISPAYGMTAAQIAQRNNAKYGVQLCVECATKKKADAEATATAEEEITIERDVDIEDN